MNILYGYMITLLMPSCKLLLFTTEDNDQTSTNSPPAKKSKLLGNVDLNSDEIQKLINAKSAHANLLSAVGINDMMMMMLSISNKETDISQ